MYQMSYFSKSPVSVENYDKYNAWKLQEWGETSALGLTRSESLPVNHDSRHPMVSPRLLHQTNPGPFLSTVVPGQNIRGGGVVWPAGDRRSGVPPKHVGDVVVGQDPVKQRGAVGVWDSHQGIRGNILVWVGSLYRLYWILSVLGAMKTRQKEWS